MSWKDQNPEATDVLLAGRAVSDRGTKVWFEIDHVHADDVAPYRITVGNLFGSQEICRMNNLEVAIRAFSEVLKKN